MDGIPGHRHPGQARDDLLQELDPLPAQLREIQEQPGDVSSRPGETAHEPLGDRIRLQIHSNDRDGLRRIGGRANRRRSDRHDGAHRKPRQLSGQRGDLPGGARPHAVVDGEIRALHEPDLLEGLAEPAEVLPEDGAVRRVPEHPDLDHERRRRLRPGMPPARPRSRPPAWRQRFYGPSTALERAQSLRRTTLKAFTGRWKPFSVSSPTPSTSAISSTPPATRCESRIWPGLASPQSREARLVTVPIAP